MEEAGRESKGKKKKKRVSHTSKDGTPRCCRHPNLSHPDTPLKTTKLANSQLELALNHPEFCFHRSYTRRSPEKLRLLYSENNHQMMLRLHLQEATESTNEIKRTTATKR